MAFYIIKGDLVSMNVDCIVADANVNLKMVEGVTRAIFHKAGDIEMTQACREIGHCDVGKAVFTPSFGISNVKGIIHAVGPNYINGKHGEEKNLLSAYKETFNILLEKGYKSIAFPLLSSEFNYPTRECYDVAKKAILEFLKDHNDVSVYLVFFKKFPEFVNDELKEEIGRFISKQSKSASISIERVEDNVEGLKMISSLQEKNGLNDNDVIFYANLTHNYFDILRNDQTYIPTRRSIIAIGIALKLQDKEMTSLLRLFGYTFAPNSVENLVIKYFLSKKTFDVYCINECLFHFDYPILSSILL